jgi:hypothetical protein
MRPYQAALPLQTPANIVVDHSQVFDISATESLRRLARQYVNNPESLVNAVRLEQGPSGRFMAVIILEITDIL